MKKLLILLLCICNYAIAQTSTQVDPATRINWPRITGAGTPAALFVACASVNYGQPYLNMATSPNTGWHCGTGGWQADPQGSGTVAAGTEGQVAYYPATGASVIGISDPCITSQGPCLVMHPASGSAQSLGGPLRIESINIGANGVGFGSNVINAVSGDMAFMGDVGHKSYLGVLGPTDTNETGVIVDASNNIQTHSVKNVPHAGDSTTDQAEWTCGPGTTTVCLSVENDGSFQAAYNSTFANGGGVQTPPCLEDGTNCPVLGTMAAQESNSVSITGGGISGASINIGGPALAVVCPGSSPFPPYYSSLTTTGCKVQASQILPPSGLPTGCVQVPCIVGQYHATGLTGGIGGTAVYTPTAAGQYRICVSVTVTAVSSTAASVQPGYSIYPRGGSSSRGFGLPVGVNLNSVIGDQPATTGPAFDCVVADVAANQPIQTQSYFGGTNTGGTYRYDIYVELMGNN